MLKPYRPSSFHILFVVISKPSYFSEFSLTMQLHIGAFEHINVDLYSMHSIALHVRLSNVVESLILFLGSCTLTKNTNESLTVFKERLAGPCLTGTFSDCEVKFVTFVCEVTIIPRLVYVLYCDKLFVFANPREKRYYDSVSGKKVAQQFPTILEIEFRLPNCKDVTV